MPELLIAKQKKGTITRNPLKSLHVAVLNSVYTVQG